MKLFSASEGGTPAAASSGAAAALCIAQNDSFAAGSRAYTKRTTVAHKRHTPS